MRFYRKFKEFQDAILSEDWHQNIKDIVEDRVPSEEEYEAKEDEIEE